MGVDAEPKFAEVRFYYYAATGDAARAGVAALDAAIRRYRGTHGALTIDDCYWRGDRPLVDDETKLIGRLVELRITYRGS